MPLFARLSRAWVAYVIEYDNAAEIAQARAIAAASAVAPVRTPWLVSLAMYSNCMRFVDRDGVAVLELVRKARAQPLLHGMSRWGYVTVDSGDVVRATDAGMRAKGVWEPLFAEIDERWRRRFGVPAVRCTEECLRALLSGIPFDLPDAMPVLGHGLLGKIPAPRRLDDPAAVAKAATLPELFAKVLLALALDYERGSELSLAMGANLLRVLDAKEELKVRDLPKIAGVSKEAVATALSYLEKNAYAEVVSRTDGLGKRTRFVRLTGKGQRAADAYRERVNEVEARWRRRFGEKNIGACEQALDELEPLLAGLEPAPENWRAKTGAPTTLPHFPMVLHRGGFPDGS